MNGDNLLNHPLNTVPVPGESSSQEGQQKKFPVSQNLMIAPFSNMVLSLGGISTSYTVAGNNQNHYQTIGLQQIKDILLQESSRTNVKDRAPTASSILTSEGLNINNLMLSLTSNTLSHSQTLSMPAHPHLADESSELTSIMSLNAPRISSHISPDTHDSFHVSGGSTTTNIRGDTSPPLNGLMRGGINIRGDTSPPLNGLMRGGINIRGDNSPPLNGLMRVGSMSCENSLSDLNPSITPVTLMETSSDSFIEVLSAAESHTVSVPSTLSNIGLPNSPVSPNSISSNRLLHKLLQSCKTDPSTSLPIRLSDFSKIPNASLKPSLSGDITCPTAAPKHTIPAMPILNSTSPVSTHDLLHTSLADYCNRSTGITSNLVSNSMAVISANSQVPLTATPPSLSDLSFADPLDHSLSDPILSKHSNGFQPHSHKRGCHPHDGSSVNKDGRYGYSGRVSHSLDPVPGGVGSKDPRFGFSSRITPTLESVSDPRPGEPLLITGDQLLTGESPISSDMGFLAHDDAARSLFLPDLHNPASVDNDLLRGSLSNAIVPDISSTSVRNSNQRSLSTSTSHHLPELPPSPILANIPPDFLAGASSSATKTSPGGSGSPMGTVPSTFLQTSPGGHPPFLPSATATENLALSFTSHFLDNSNMSIDMGSLSEGDGSLNVASGEDSNLGHRKSELTFTHALKNVTATDKVDEVKVHHNTHNFHKRGESPNILGVGPDTEPVFKVPADDTFFPSPSKRQPFSSKEIPLIRIDSDSPFSPASPHMPPPPPTMPRDTPPLGVQEVSCFKCQFCSFLSQDKGEIQEHIRLKHGFPPSPTPIPTTAQNSSQKRSFSPVTKGKSINSLVKNEDCYLPDSKHTDPDTQGRDPYPQTRDPYPQDHRQELKILPKRSTASNKHESKTNSPASKRRKKTDDNELESQSLNIMAVNTSPQASGKKSKQPAAKKKPCKKKESKASTSKSTKKPIPSSNTQYKVEYLPDDKGSFQRRIVEVGESAPTPISHPAETPDVKPLLGTKIFSPIIKMEPPDLQSVSKRKDQSQAISKRIDQSQSFLKRIDQSQTFSNRPDHLQTSNRTDQSQTSFIPVTNSNQPQPQFLNKPSTSTVRKSEKTANTPPTTQPTQKPGRPPAAQTMGIMKFKKSHPKVQLPEEALGFRCGVNGCGLRMKEERNIRYHRQCHFGAFLKCPECQTRFSHWASLAVHLWKNHLVDLELHKCEKCDFKSYSYTKLMNGHWKTHSTERPFLCDVCGKDFKTGKQLKSHKLLHVERSEDLKHHCDMCKRKFAEKRMLLLHLEAVHKKVKPFLCNYCGNSFASKSTLNLHIRKHTGEKPFACESCAYRTSDHNSMRRHRMKHTNDRPYSCPYCDYSSIQSSTFKVHLRRKHEVQAQKDGVIFSCSFCNFKTVKKDNFLAHVGTHHVASEEEQNKEAEKQQQQIQRQAGKKQPQHSPKQPPKSNKKQANKLQPQEPQMDLQQPQPVIVEQPQLQQTQELVLIKADNSLVSGANAIDPNNLLVTTTTSNNQVSQPKIELLQQNQQTQQQPMFCVFRELVPVPNVVNIDVNEEDTDPPPELVSRVLLQGSLPNGIPSILMSQGEPFMYASSGDAGTGILQQVNINDGVLQLTPEVVAMPVNSSLPTSGGQGSVSGLFYVAAPPDTD